MSTSVVGFRPIDEKWKQMKAVWDACESAGVDPPEEVAKFFEYCEPDNAGVEVSIRDAATKWHNSYASGYEVDITKLPEGVKIIRFFNSW